MRTEEAISQKPPHLEDEIKVAYADVDAPNKIQDTARIAISADVFLATSDHALRRPSCDRFSFSPAHSFCFDQRPQRLLNQQVQRRTWG